MKYITISILSFYVKQMTFSILVLHISAEC